MEEDITNRLWFCPECKIYWSIFYPIDANRYTFDAPERLCKHCGGEE